MNIVQIITNLANQKGISIAELERTIGLSNATISRWKTASPNSKGLEAVADYFNVTTDYLLGRENIDKSLTNRDKKDIADYMQSLRDDLANGQGIHFYGEPIDDEDVDIILRQLEFGAEMILKNKKKQMAGD